MKSQILKYYGQLHSSVKKLTPVYKAIEITRKKRSRHMGSDNC